MSDVRTADIVRAVWEDWSADAMWRRVWSGLPVELRRLLPWPAGDCPVGSDEDDGDRLDARWGDLDWWQRRLVNGHLWDALDGQMSFSMGGLGVPLLEQLMGWAFDPSTDRGLLMRAEMLHAAGVPDVGDVSGLAEAARWAGWWWPFQDVVVVSERPVTVGLDAGGRLHHPTGPAASYPDGSTVHAWHDTIVPADLVEQPESITLERIRQETPSTLRWVMLERFGYQRYVQEAGGRLLNDDPEYGRLWRAPVPDDKPLVVLQTRPRAGGPAEAVGADAPDRSDATATVHRAGTSTTVHLPDPAAQGGVAWLRVPANIRRARHAAAWLARPRSDVDL